MNLRVKTRCGKRFILAVCYRRALLPLALLLFFLTSGCATVPQYRRGHLADRTMPGNEDKLKKASRRKFHVTREAAAGGDGEPAGGGCGCGN